MTIEQGDENSWYVNGKQETAIKRLGWEHKSPQKILTEALQMAATFQEIQREKKEEIRQIERTYDL